MSRQRAPDPVGPDIIEFTTSRHFLGKPISILQSAILKGFYGLDMTREERLAFLKATEGREPKKGGYDELVGVAGIRSGKSDRIGGVIATYEAVRWGPVIGPLLQPGQVARVILIAENQTQAGEVRSYIEGNLQTLEEPECECGCHWPGGVLKRTEGQAKPITGDVIRLQWPVEIKVYPANRVAVRGATGLAGVLDEIAYWQCGEGAYNQDTKIVKAFRGRFATLARIRPKRVMISSPDEKSGVLWEEYRQRASSKALVFCAASWELNPTLDQDFLDREQEKDPEAFLSDYAAQFKEPGGGNIFLDPRTVDQCIDRGVQWREPIPGRDYISWIDAAFKRDRFSLSIGHAERQTEGVTVYQDACRHWTPSKRKGADPLNDDEIVAEIVSDYLRPYGIDRVHGDQHCDTVLANKFRKLGITFVLQVASKTEKFEAYKNLRAALKAGYVRLLDDEVTIRDLKCLVRKETRDGYTVSAPKRRSAYDDASTPVSRIVAKLLPLSSAMDHSEWNKGALKEDRWRGLDWRDKPSEMDEYGFGGVDIMNARF